MRRILLDLHARKALEEPEAEFLPARWILLQPAGMPAGRAASCRR